MVDVESMSLQRIGKCKDFQFVSVRKTSIIIKQ